jgi:hypothetical protein
VVLWKLGEVTFSWRLTFLRHNHALIAQEKIWLQLVLLRLLGNVDKLSPLATHRSMLPVSRGLEAVCKAALTARAMCIRPGVVRVHRMKDMSVLLRLRYRYLLPLVETIMQMIRLCLWRDVFSVTPKEKSFSSVIVRLCPSYKL